MGRRRGGRRIAERADAAGRPRYLGGERAGTASHEDGEAAAEVLRLERNQAGGAGPPALRRDRAEQSVLRHEGRPADSSEERRVGKGGVSTCSYGWEPKH